VLAGAGDAEAAVGLRLGGKGVDGGLEELAGEARPVREQGVVAGGGEALGEAGG
jgi:hypothetical protein